MTKKIALAAVAASLLAGTAFAQSAPPAGSAAPAAKMETTVMPSTAAGKWRASKLIGVNVYNANNEKIGDINELVTDSSGKIDTIVVGVGGFVGIGEHNVGIPFSQVKFVNEPVKTSATTTTNTTGTGAATRTTTTTVNGTARDYPDHAMVNMSKDQLKAMPAYKYASDTSATQTTTTRPAPAPAPAPAR